MYNVLKATLKLLEPFYHHIISFLHLKTRLTLEKYTEFDSRAEVKREDILGKCWAISQQLWGELQGRCVSTNSPQRPGSPWPGSLMDEGPIKDSPGAPPWPILLK